MGYEAHCTLRIGQEVSRGTAILEHRDLIFRGPTRIAIPLKTIASAVADDGTLTVRFGRTTAVFDLGAVASRWADRITNPPSRLDKLGVKPGMTAMVSGERHADLVRELKTRGARVVRAAPPGGADLVFYGASKRDMLDRVREVKQSLKPNGALWVIRPKGSAAISESDVMAAGKNAGLVDVKVVSFSETHTAEKFVIRLRFVSRAAQLGALGTPHANKNLMSEFNERLLSELVDAVRDLVKKEQSDRLRDIYLVGDIEKDTARQAIERLRELANEGHEPITIYINSAGGNVTDGLALHDTIRHLVSRGYEITIVVQGMAYSMGSIVLQAASPGKRFAFPHSWIMIHEPAKWAGWQSTSAAAQHLDRLKQMQSQIYRILADRSGKPLRQIIRDTKRTDFYLDAVRAREYGLIDEVLGPVEAVRPDQSEAQTLSATEQTETLDGSQIAASERPPRISSN